jgi:hypothetical protein
MPHFTNHPRNNRSFLSAYERRCPCDEVPITCKTAIHYPFWRARLALLYFLRPSRSCCLLCPLRSLGSRHALRGIGPALLPSTHRTILQNYEPGIGMNRAMFRHSRVRYQIAGIGRVFGLRHHDLNLQAVECFPNVVVAILDDSSEVWPLNRVICLCIPDPAQ